jgi:hypothetical protein
LIYIAMIRLRLGDSLASEGFSDSL